MIKRFLKSSVIFFVILGVSFSNVPFYALSGLINSYEKSSGIVDKIWLVQQNHDSDVVDNFSSLRNISEKLRVMEAMAAAPTFVNKGAFASGVGALTVGVPAAYQDNDVFLLFVESANEVIATPGGWTQVTNSPQGTGTAAAAGGVRLGVFYKIVTGAQGSVTVADSGNHTTAIIMGFRGVDTASPVNISAGAVSAATTAMSLPTVTTTVVDTFVVLAAAMDTDAASTATVTGWANASLTGITERHDQTITSGVGGGLAIATGVKATAGATGATTATGSTSVTHAYLTIALKPLVPVTTITNFVSAEPGDSTIAPNASGMVDSFGLATNSGADTVTAVTVGLAAGMGQYIQTVAITNNGDTVTYCSVAPSADTASLSSCTVPVTTTNTQFKIKLTADPHASMPVPAGGSYAVTATVTGWTGTNTTHAGTDSGSSTLTIDNASPSGATSVSGTAGNAANTINWTTSNSGDFDTTNGSVILRWASGSAGAEVPAEGNSTYTAGNTITTATVACVISSTTSAAQSKIDGTGGDAGCTTTALTNGQAYTYKAFQRDTNGNYDVGVLIGTFTPSAPAAVLTVGTSGSQTANIDSGVSNTHLGGAFTFSINIGTASVSNIKVSNNGTAGNLSDIRLYYDTDGTYSGGESCFNTVCTDGGGGTLGTGIAGSMGTLSSGTTYYVYVVADISSSVAGGGTIDLQITNPSTDITTSATNTDTAAKNITSLTTVRPNVTDVTNSPLVDGGRNDDGPFTITGAGFGTACGSLSVVVGGLTLTCNSANNTTISATIPSTQTTTYGGASSMLVTVGGTADDASQTYYVYPSVNLVSTPLVSNAARELENITLTNSTANASRFGATQGTVTFSGGFGSVSGSVVSWGDTSIEVTVPAEIADNIYTGDITVTRNADSKTDLAYDSNGFRILPRITLLTPTSGPNGQSTTIDGDHLCQPSGTCQSAATFNGTADDGNDVEWGTTDAVVTGTPTNTQIIVNAPTLSDGGYQVTVTSGGGTSYTSNELTFTIANNASPTLSISAPPAGSTTIAEGSTYNVTYTLGDTDNVVTAAFYYDTNGDGVGGTAITGCGAKAEGTGATCSFDTSVLSVSTPYYVYGVTTDGVNPTVTTVSSGTITVSDAPTLSISAPPAGNTAVAEGSSYNVTYTLSDTDNVVTSAFYYDTNGDGVGGTAITGCGTKAEGTGATCSFDTSVLSVSTPYYVYGVTTDGVNPTVTTVSSGTITVNDAPTITVSQPDGTGDTVNAGDLYNITYTLADTDNVVTVDFYYDSNSSGLDGTAITGCQDKAEGAGVTCSWDTTSMSPGTYYVYGRGVSDGVNAEVSDYSPGMITINAPPQVVADSVGTQTANFDSGVTGQYVGAAWTFRQTTGSADTITALTLSDVGGSVNANVDLSNAFLRYEQPGASTCTYNGTETSTGTVGFNVSDQAVFSGLTIPVTLHATNVTCVYLIFDLKNGTAYPAGGQTFEPEITSSANFTLQNSTAKAGTYPVTLSGTTTVRPNVTDVTNSALVDGGRNGDTFTITGTGFGSSCASVSVVVGGLTLTCNSAATTTISATIPATQTTTYGGASSMLVTVGGTADDASQTYYVYPSVSLVSTPLVSNAARELENITLTNSTANASRFGATEGTVTFTGGFGSVGATVVSWGDTSILVTVPSAIADNVYLGDITVTRNADSKTDTAYGSNGFRILPKITSLDPASASVGDPITVNGNHLCQAGAGSCPTVSFDSNNKVTFTSGVDATVFTSWSNTVIVTEVPTSAVTGNVVVTSDTYASNGSTFTLASSIPDDPASLGQFKDAGFTQTIAIGGTASSTPIYLKMTMSAALSGGTLYPQVEYKAIGSAFTCGAGVCGAVYEGTGSAGPGPATSSVSVSPADEVYHWQARVRHNRNAVDYYSAWVPFGGNGENETDFKIDTTAPVITSTSSGSPGTNGATITWSTSGEISTSRVEYDTAGTFTGGYDCAGTSECTTLADTSPMVNSHSVTLSNLNSATTYHYRVRSKDAAGNEKIDPTSGDYTFVTQTENHPAKSTNTFIDGATGTISGATTYYFKVDAPETTPSVKSAYVEVIGVVSGGTGTVTVAVNGSSRAYDVSAANPTLYRFMYPIASPNTEINLNLNDVAPCSNAVVPGTPPKCNKVVLTPATVSVNVLSAKIITTYSYTP